MKKKKYNIFTIILIGLMVIGIGSNALVSINLIKSNNETRGVTEGLSSLNRLVFSGLGYLVNKTYTPDFNKLLEGTVVIYNHGAMATGVLIRKDKNYYYILTVNHIVNKRKNNSGSYSIAVPESNLGYAIKIETIKRFLRSNLNEVNPKNYLNIEIVLHNYDKYRGEVIKADPNYDLALIRIVRAKNTNLQLLPLTKLPVKVGDPVFISGHPLAIYYNITQGIVSNLRDANFMVVDATMTFGNSGGGVYNRFGELIGICDKVPIYFATTINKKGANNGTKQEK